MLGDQVHQLCTVVTDLKARSDIQTGARTACSPMASTSVGHNLGDVGVGITGARVFAEYNEILTSTAPITKDRWLARDWPSSVRKKTPTYSNGRWRLPPLWLRRSARPSHFGWDNPTCPDPCEATVSNFGLLDKARDMAETGKRIQAGGSRPRGASTVDRHIDVLMITGDSLQEPTSGTGFDGHRWPNYGSNYSDGDSGDEIRYWIVTRKDPHE